MSTKTIVIVLVVIAAVVSLGYWKIQRRDARTTTYPMATPPAANAPTGDTMQNLPVATGNVDATVDALLSEVAEENQLLLEEGNDADLINTEVDALDQYGQSYVPTEL